MSDRQAYANPVTYRNSPLPHIQTGESQGIVCTIKAVNIAEENSLPRVVPCISYLRTAHSPNELSSPILCARYSQSLSLAAMV